MNPALSEIQEQLKGRRELSVDLRGSGKSAFLYVRSAKRAAEVSTEGDEFFVEYWSTADEKSDSPAARSEIVKSFSQVLKKLTAWL